MALDTDTVRVCWRSLNQLEHLYLDLVWGKVLHKPYSALTVNMKQQQGTIDNI